MSELTIVEGDPRLIRSPCGHPALDVNPGQDIKRGVRCVPAARSLILSVCQQVAHITKITILEYSTRSMSNVLGNLLRKLHFSWLKSVINISRILIFYFRFQ